jgi:hypothetical protein
MITSATLFGIDNIGTQSKCYKSDDAGHAKCATR